MKKSLIVVGAVVLVIICLFFVYKFHMLNQEKSAYVELDTKQIFNDVITINKKTKPSGSDVIKVGNMTMTNYCKGYKKYDENPSFKVKYSGKKMVSFYSITSMKQYVEVFSIDSLALSDSKSIDNKDYVTSKSMKKFFAKNNIKNDVDLLKYIKENYYFKSNVFTSTKTMKNNYLLNTFVEVTLPEYDSITLIDGKVDGYILNMKNDLKEIHILNKDRQYIIIIFGKDVINKDFMTKLLESVSFK